MEKIVEGNSSEREQLPEDKDEGPAEEVRLGAGGILKEMPHPQLTGSLQSQLLYLDVLHLSH